MKFPPHKGSPPPLNRPANGKDGSVIVMVLVVLFIITSLSVISLRNAMHMMRMSQRQVLLEQAHFVAEAGLEEAARRISSNEYLGAGPTQMSIQLSDGRTTEVTITPLDTEGMAFKVQSVSSVEGMNRTLNIERVFRPTYLEYGMYFEDWRGYYWIAGDVVDGKVWSGTPQGIWGYYQGGKKLGPIFRQENQTASDGFAGWPEFGAHLPPHIPFDEHTESDLEYFDEGSDSVVTGMEMPALMTVDFERHHNIANALAVSPEAISPDHVAPDLMPKGRALVLEGRTEMRFDVEEVNGQEVGVIYLRNREAFGNFNHQHKVYSEALDLIVIRDKPDGNAQHRNGTLTLGDPNPHAASIVKGSLSIWVDHDVEITSHVIYDNQNFEESTDSLGIVSKRNIYVDRIYSGSQQHSGDLYLQAGLIATGISGNGEIGLKRYDKNNVRGTLYFTGSQVGKRRYPWGTTNNGQLIHGYHRSLTFDPRFSTRPPPFTPTIDSEVRYEGWH